VEESLTEPEDIAAAIQAHLRAALTEIELVTDSLAGEVVEEATP
jgi:ribosomal protein L22